MTVGVSPRAQARGRLPGRLPAPAAAGAVLAAALVALAVVADFMEAMKALVADTAALRARR